MGQASDPEPITQALRQRHLSTAENQRRQQAASLFTGSFDETTGDTAACIGEGSRFLTQQPDGVGAQTTPTPLSSQSPGGIRKQGMGRWLGPRQRSANLNPGPLQQRLLAGFQREFRAAMTDHAIDAADLQQRTATVIPNRRISADATNELHHWRRTLHRGSAEPDLRSGAEAPRPSHIGCWPDRASRRKRGTAEGFASNGVPSQPTPMPAR